METPKKMANWVTKNKEFQLRMPILTEPRFDNFLLSRHFTSTILHDFNKRRVFVAIMEAKLKLELG